MISTSKMEVQIARRFNARVNIIVPKISWGIFIHECDVFIIRPSGYVVEVEIKRSISDLKNDFNKKHQHKDNRIKELYYAIPRNLLEKALPIIRINMPNAGIIICRDRAKKAVIANYAETNKKTRKLTMKEQLKVAKLGTMRIWNLKEKLIKGEKNET